MANKSSAEHLLDDLTAVIRDAEGLLKATASQTGEKVAEVRARAEETVRQAKARLAGFEDQAREAAGEADKFVRGNPWQAVGIAAAVGLVLGVLISRR
jgi:ElaB/YqjD/DUF883 family membrane-anchored ribosome-binding protein